MSHFVIGEISIGKGADPQPPPLGYAYVLSEENRKGVRKFSARFLAFSNEISTVQKIVLSSSRGQADFRGLEASRPRPRTWPSRPRPRPRTSKCVLEDVLEAKDVLEDSTSGNLIIITVITYYSPSCLGQEAAKGSFCVRIKLPPVYHIRWRLQTVPFIAVRQAGKLWTPIFIVFGLTRPGIEPESTVSVADILSTRPLIGRMTRMVPTN